MIPKYRLTLVSVGAAILTRTLDQFKVLQAYWPPPVFERHALEHDPFIVECRVYNLLTEGKKLGTVGPSCFGWLTITRDQEAELSQKLRYAFDWTRMSSTEK